MAKYILWHNPRCAKSREGLKILEGMDVEIRRYIDNPPTCEELKELLEKLGMKPSELVRKKEKLYKDRINRLTFLLHNIEDLKNNMLAGDNHIKAMLAILSQSEDIKDFRILEEFFKQCKPKLRSWSALAYAESRSRISSSLTNEEFTVLVGGLGGKNKD